MFISQNILENKVICLKNLWNYTKGLQYYRTKVFEKGTQRKIFSQKKHLKKSSYD